MRYFIDLSYNGTAYHGWQIQPNANSIQQELESALSQIFNTKTEVVGSGRTDAGVHALRQIVHFDGEETDTYKLTQRLNYILPEQIQARNIYTVKESSHARFDATLRSYVYKVHFSSDPFLNDRSLLLFNTPDIEIMNQACKDLIGLKDFECFSKVKTDVTHFNCEIYKAQWNLVFNGLHFHISANRFLRGMVRAIVGALLEIGLKQKPVYHINELVESKDRSKAGASVKAKGLYLSDVQYPYIQFDN